MKKHPQLDDLRLTEDGVQICRQVLSTESVVALKAAIAEVIADEPVKPYGVRSIAERCPAAGALIHDTAISQIVEAAIPLPWLLVRSIFFDKVPGANWHVGWHQDLSIAVKARPDADVPGYSGWTEKAGVPHVQAPADLLGQMVTLRIHLDAAGPENGPLRVIPGSHRERLDSEQIEERIGAGPKVECLVESGDILAMRPTLLHASHKAESPRHRRIVHLEFGPAKALPEGLEWSATP